MPASYRYDIYGKQAVPVGTETDATASELGYAGALKLSDGLLHLKARTYAPALRKFLQPDTVDPLRYTYVRGDPANMIDPNGRQAVRCYDGADDRKHCDKIGEKAKADPPSLGGAWKPNLESLLSQAKQMATGGVSGMFQSLLNAFEKAAGPVGIVHTPEQSKFIEAAKKGAQIAGAIITVEGVIRNLGPNDPPQRYHGPWTERDLQRAKEGKGPLDFVPAVDKNGKPLPLELHHGDQMPGSGVHEVAPGSREHLLPGMHQNRRTQGVTDQMREQDRELHWQMRGQEMGNPPLEGE